MFCFVNDFTGSEIMWDCMASLPTHCPFILLPIMEIITNDDFKN